MSELSRYRIAYSISSPAFYASFSIAFVVSSFLALRKHDLVADTVGLGISIRVIIMLIV